MNLVRNYEGISKPLLVAQVTELVDGIFIGCSISHAVMDSTSFWHFFNTWSEISRFGSDHDKVASQISTSSTPVFGRQFLVGLIDLPSYISLEYKGDSAASWSSISLLTRSSPRFNVYGNDFGWGRPLAVPSEAVDKRSGKLTVFPGTKEGSVDFEVYLLPKILQAMGDDAEFMEAVLT
ncbi:putative anthocyanin 6''-O-malonyltransferase [Rosa chinensis]|uniref:Putative anthocyanin 6''-O-malonyltransferase n=1 Tax=Rosa chinensis TaxID=74649 RepID=A0A2P6RNN1_ROSCH|nr:putative anthocyanin 6''-O-malonyltransferase [Rosa chinensis]